MSSRYIARKYGESRPPSRAQSVNPESWSRGSSQIRDLDSSFSSRAGSPVGDVHERPWSSASTYNYYSSSRPTSPAPGTKREWTEDLIPEQRAKVPQRGDEFGHRSRRAATPNRAIYSEALLKSSRKLRERSFSPTRHHITNVSPTVEYKENQDYYRGKTKSIYEREPMFADFVRNLPLTDLHAASSRDLSRLKKKFQVMVEDRWGRKQCNDPSVPHDTAYSASSWSNYLSRPEPASSALAEKHKYRSRLQSALPRIYVYHRSTQF